MSSESSRKPWATNTRAELADLVPEDRVVPVLDVEVVVLDERDTPGARARSTCRNALAVVIGRQELAVLAGDPLALGQDLLQRPVDVLARARSFSM